MSLLKCTYIINIIIVASITNGAKSYLLIATYVTKWSFALWTYVFTWRLRYTYFINFSFFFVFLFPLLPSAFSSNRLFRNAQMSNDEQGEWMYQEKTENSTYSTPLHCICVLLLVEYHNNKMHRMHVFHYWIWKCTQFFFSSVFSIQSFLFFFHFKCANGYQFSVPLLILSLSLTRIQNHYTQSQYTQYSRQKPVQKVREKWFRFVYLQCLCFCVCFSSPDSVWSV